MTSVSALANKAVMFGLAAASALAACPPAMAATPTPLLQYSELTGTGGAITITRLPVVTLSGKIAFYDVSFGLTASSTGVLSYSGPITQTMSPTLPVDNFKPGTYVDPTNAANTITLSGPGPINAGGVAVWTITPTGGTPCGSPATFYTGPLKQNPLYARISAANIIDTEFAYGVIDAGTGCGNPWFANYLVGVQQIGNQIDIASFTNFGTDQSMPVLHILYDFVK